MSVIWSLIGSLPTLIKWIDAFILAYQKRKANNWLAEENQVINNEIPNIKTQEDALKAAKDLQSLTKDIGK